MPIVYLKLPLIESGLGPEDEHADGEELLRELLLVALLLEAESCLGDQVLEVGLVPSDRAILPVKNKLVPLREVFLKNNVSIWSETPSRFR